MTTRAGRSRPSVHWLVWGALTGTIALSSIALAAASGPAPAKHHGAKPKPRGAPAGRDAGADLDASARTAAREENEAGVEIKVLDSGTRVLRFGEMEIEGRLQSPQIVYFLRRVRAEFEAENLGHRTFMRELSETRKEPTF